ATETRPALIVVDTLAHAIKGGDENSAQDMGAITATVGELIRKTGACVLLVHHSGKNKTAGARGSSALLGAIDTQIEIDEKQIKVSKQRDGALAEPMGFALQSMVVDVDEDGDDITSCVVVPDTIHDNTDGLPRLTGNARHGFDLLCDMAPDNVPVDVREWREACGEAFLDGKKVSQRFYDMLRVLRTKGYVLVEKGKARRRLE
ncbi:MAG: helicase RepA family protein, partial [Betaproteobacteria bacterium]|nr:helicase RepA family protein [Betaproteobacteria bacterium]